MIGAALVSILLVGVLVGFVAGFMVGIDAARKALAPPRRPVLVPQVIHQGHPDRIEQTVFTPRDYHPGPGWTYYPEFREWRRGARY